MQNYHKAPIPPRLSAVVSAYTCVSFLDTYCTGNIVKKVMIKHFANLDKQLDVDVIFLENFVGMRTCAADFPRKPCHRTFLPPELLSDQHSYVYIHNDIKWRLPVGGRAAPK